MSEDAYKDNVKEAKQPREPMQCCPPVVVLMLVPKINILDGRHVPFLPHKLYLLCRK